MRCLGVLGGEAVSSEALRTWSHACDATLAADRGLSLLQAAGLLPDVLIGDLDSVTGLESLPDLLIHRDNDENRSDVEKLLAYAEKSKFREVVLICGHGGRLDHTLANFSSALASSLIVRFVYPSDHSILLKAGFQGRFEVGRGRRVSMLPLGGPATVDFKGVQWPLTNQKLEFGKLVSLSNESAEKYIDVAVMDGAVLLIVDQPAEEIPPW